MAWNRVSLAMMAFGIASIRACTTASIVLGTALCVVGVVYLVLSMYRYRQVFEHLHQGLFRTNAIMVLVNAFLSFLILVLIIVLVISVGF